MGECQFNEQCVDHLLSYVVDGTLETSNYVSMKVLWLSPMLNHYKARFLDRLHEGFSVDITVMSGTGRSSQGDYKWTEKTKFKLIRLPVAKQDFGLSKTVRNEINSVFVEFDWIMIPKEHKNLPLFLYLLWLRKSKSSSVRFFCAIRRLNFYKRHPAPRSLVWSLKPKPSMKVGT